MLFVKTTVSLLLLATVIVVVGYQFGVAGVVVHLHQLSYQTLAMVVVCLIANAMLAVFRLQVLASDAGHSIGLRRAMAAVSAGSLAGALFFQIAGQLMARGVVMRRSGVPFGAVVVVTLYERIVAAMVSGLIAVLGALHIFGRVYLDQTTGGAQLVKLVCGVAAAVGMAGSFGFGGLVRQNVWPLLTRQFVMRFLRIAGLTLLVQLPMMSVYVALALDFSPRTPVIDLIAASAIVMFAASVPISLAGWGVRELSAVVALGAIGMTASAALTTAVIIGAGSLLAMGIIAAISLHDKADDSPADKSETAAVINYARALEWILPLMAAVFVLFQVYLPIGSGLLNVNLADPIVILGGSLFILNAASNRRLPIWRARCVTLFGLTATLALGLSLLLGAYRFGWTDWALINRFLGWFVLLAYAMTGALITSTGGERGLRALTLSYLGATVGVVAIEIALLLVSAVGVSTNGLIIRSAIEGFAQNHNFLAFQLLIAVAAALVQTSGTARRIAVAVVLAGLWLTGSRSGWVSAVGALGVALYLRWIGLRELSIAVGYAIVLGAVISLMPTMVSHLMIVRGSYGGAPLAVPDIIPNASESAERLMTLVGGWKMFTAHPIFGAGLGAFRNLHILAGSGIPLVIHSTALWLLAELGLVGFLAFAGPSACILYGEWRRAAQDRASAIIILCFVGFAIMSGPADMVYQRTYWLLVGASLAVVVRGRAADEPDSDTPRYVPGAA